MLKKIYISFIVIVLCVSQASALKGTISEKREAFLEMIVPAAMEANYRITQQRITLLDIRDKLTRTGLISRDQLLLMSRLGEEYDMKNYHFHTEVPSLMLIEFLEELISRVDVVPVKLLVAQSIIETGWGHSRSAQYTHNYFGITSSMGGSGFVVTTSAYATYYLQAYATPADGVQAYIMLLNGKRSYEEFRKLRREARADNRPMDAVVLSAGLMKYSEMGQRYIDKVNYVIRKYLSGPEMAQFIM